MAPGGLRRHEARGCHGHAVSQVDQDRRGSRQPQQEVHRRVCRRSRLPGLGEHQGSTSDDGLGSWDWFIVRVAEQVKKAAQGFPRPQGDAAPFRRPGARERRNQAFSRPRPRSNCFDTPHSQEKVSRVRTGFRELRRWPQIRPTGLRRQLCSAACCRASTRSRPGRGWKPCSQADAKSETTRSRKNISVPRFRRSSASFRP
jgi:hypothetical protein